MSILFESIYVGLRTNSLIRDLEISKARAAIVEGYHSGTAHACAESNIPRCEPDCTYSIIPFLERARERRVPVFLTFGYFVGDEDATHGFRPFEESHVGYETSAKMVRAGIVPLKANWQRRGEVFRRLDEVLDHAIDYETIIREMYLSFPFKSSLDKIRASVK